MAANLADLMGHRTATAERCYRMVNREKTCVAAAKTLSGITGHSEISVSEMLKKAKEDKQNKEHAMKRKQLQKTNKKNMVQRRTSSKVAARKKTPICEGYHSHH